jgi:hypothetical protein
MPFKDIVKRRCAVTEARRRIKQRLIDFFGGRCQRCGYNKSNSALTFHHRDPATKEFGLGVGGTKSFARCLAEAEKCDLLCHNCHAEIHDEWIQKAWQLKLVNYP